MSVLSWLLDLGKAAVADAILRRPIDFKYRRNANGQTDVDVRMSPSGTQPQQLRQPQPMYYGGYPGYYPPGYPAPPPQPFGQPQPAPPADGKATLPRSFDG